LSKRGGKSKGSHHLDKYAADIVAASEGDADELMSTEQLAVWLRVSVQWLEMGRWKGWGPPYKRVSPKMVRYKRSDVLQWLEERTHACTSEYRG
jgi:hypothetical protein